MEDFSLSRAEGPALFPTRHPTWTIQNRTPIMLHLQRIVSTVDAVALSGRWA